MKNQQAGNEASLWLMECDVTQVSGSYVIPGV